MTLALPHQPYRRYPLLGETRLERAIASAGVDA